MSEIEELQQTIQELRETNEALFSQNLEYWELYNRTIQRLNELKNEIVQLQSALDESAKEHNKLIIKIHELENKLV